MGISFIFSIANSANAGKAKGMAKNILELAVYFTAILAATFDLPSGAPVSGSSISMPLCISALRMNQLFTNPPVMQAVVLEAALSKTSRAPVAYADLFRLIYRIVSATKTEEQIAPIAPFVISCVV